MHHALHTLCAELYQAFCRAATVLLGPWNTMLLERACGDAGDSLIWQLAPPPRAMQRLQ